MGYLWIKLPANNNYASLTSIKSMSSNVKFAFFKTFCIAGTGPKPIISGGTPTDEKATSRANGFKLCFDAADSDANKTAAAPSQMPDAEPAVTTPSFLNTGCNFARDSNVVFGLQKKIK